MMKMKELISKNLQELALLLKDTEKELVDLRGQLALKKLKNVSEIKNKKKDIARVLTLIKQKEGVA